MVRFLVFFKVKFDSLWQMIKLLTIWMKWLIQELFMFNEVWFIVSLEYDLADWQLMKKIYDLSEVANLWQMSVQNILIWSILSEIVKGKMVKFNSFWRYSLTVYWQLMELFDNMDEKVNPWLVYVWNCVELGWSEAGLQNIFLGSDWKFR